MSNEQTVMLFTRPGCHLCELVESMLQDLQKEWRAVDIEGEPELEERYGLRIPVLRFSVSGDELGFPFEQAQLSEFLDGQGSLANDQAG